MKNNFQEREVRLTGIWSTIAVLALMLLLAMSSGCSPKLTPYTDSLREQYGWDEYQLSRISFYTSGRIVLTADTFSRKIEIKKGVVYDNTGQSVEQIIIPANTPGKCIFVPKAQRLAISFTDDDEAYSIFGPNPKKRGYYTFLAEEWGKGIGRVNYKDQKWLVSNEAGLVFLQVDLRKIKKSKTKTTVLTGRRLRGGP